MTPSQKAIDLVKEQEGCVLHAYRDKVGVWTIGYGCTYYPGGQPVRQGDNITQQRADDLLGWQLKLKSAGVNSCVLGIILNQNQFDALVDFVYNLGVGALQKSTLLQKIKANPADPEIRDEFMKWVMAGGHVLDTLVKRRKAEADLYFE